MASIQIHGQESLLLGTKDLDDCKEKSFWSYVFQPRVFPRCEALVFSVPQTTVKVDKQGFFHVDEFKLGTMDTLTEADALASCSSGVAHSMVFVPGESYKLDISKSVSKFDPHPWLLAKFKKRHLLHEEIASCCIK